MRVDAPMVTFASPLALSAFDDASMELLKARALLQRMDRKFLLPGRALEAFVTTLSGDYRVLRAGTRLVARYHTWYFDTADRRMFDDHRRDRRPRYKVRVRHHLDRGLSFLEIKCKRNEHHTTKSVLGRRFGDSSLDEEAASFVNAHCPIRAPLQRQMWVSFQRITLVGVRVNERVTLDLGLEVGDGSRHEATPSLVIVEIKQGRVSNSTPAVRALRALHVQERSVSKYCLATVRLADVRANVFKPALRVLEQLAT